MDLPTAHAWRDQSHEFFYPARNATLPTATAVYTGRSWDKTAFIKNLEAFRPFTAEVGDRNKKKNAENKKTAKYPLRTKLPDHQPGHAKQTILANHFELKVDTDCLYEYEILDLDNDGRSRKRIQALFQRSIDAWPHLNTNKDSFATDKRKIIVSWKDLHQNFIKQPQLAGNGPEQEGAVWPAEDITTGRVPITARFKFVGKVNLDALRRRAEANFQEVASDLSSAERCLNILISKTFDQDVHRLSTNKFFVKRARNALHYNTGGLRGNSESLEIIRGYYYAIRPGTGSLMMNFNVATSAFFRPVLVSEFLADTVTFKNTVEKLSILSKLRVYVEPDHKEERFRKLGARIKTIAGLGDNTERNIKDLSFNKKRRNPDGTLLMVNNVQQYESNETFVIDHLKEVFNVKSIIGDRKAVNCGMTQDPKWYAQELLRIVPYQLFTRPVPDCLTGSMVEQAAFDPAVAQSLIENEGLPQMGFSEVKDEKTSFRNGVPLSLYPTMMKIDCTRMPFPAVQYRFNKFNSNDSKGKGKAPASDKPPAITKSGWNIPDNQRVHTSSSQKMKYFVIQMLDGSKSPEAEKYVNLFDNELAKQLARRCHLDGDKVERVNPKFRNTSLQYGDVLADKVEQASRLGADFVVLMISTFDRHKYAEFKSLVDRKYGMNSVCIAKPELLEKQADKYMTNIVQKFNFKTGGVNASVEGIEGLLDNNTLVLGADVVHPGLNAFEESPSVACIVGSVDNQGSKFYGSARLQSKDKADREIIDHVQEMVEERIKAWQVGMNTQGRLPNNIVYYRDGVSEGQYDKVLDIEVKAITKAWKAVKDAIRTPVVTKPGDVTTPSIAAIVGVKRHHTRFYPIHDDDKDGHGNNNCKPGTCVDTVVTSPYFQDFYLQSHSGIKGTARATHYFILTNNQANQKLKASASLRKLTHHLCYTYCRATGGISYASPTYYADRLCDRARLYLPNTWSGNNATLAAQIDPAAKKAFNDSRQTKRDQTYRNGQKFVKGSGVKDPAEIQDEAQDAEQWRLHVRGCVMKAAQAEFYEHKPGGTFTGNPWHEKLSKVMFWM